MEQENSKTIFIGHNHTGELSGKLKEDMEKSFSDLLPNNNKIMKYYEVSQSIDTRVTKSIEAFEEAIRNKEIEEADPKYGASWGTGIFSFDGKDIICVRENWDSSG